MHKWVLLILSYFLLFACTIILDHTIVKPTTGECYSMGQAIQYWRDTNDNNTSQFNDTVDKARKLCKVSRLEQDMADQDTDGEQNLNDDKAKL